MDLGLKEKLIIVSGQTGKIGDTICKVLRSEGARVIVADKKNGIDLNNSINAQKFLLEDAIEGGSHNLYGYVCLIFGGGEERGTFDSQPHDSWMELKENLLAAIYTIQQATQIMKGQREGHIVIMSSISSLLEPDESAYDMAKNTLNRIAPDIAASYGYWNISATTLCLGAVGKTLYWQEKTLNRIANSVPGKKVISPEEIAHIIAFLLSNHAKTFNGTTLVTNRRIGMETKSSFQMD